MHPQRWFRAQEAITPTVDICTLPVVCVPSCKDGSKCAQQHPYLEEGKSLSLFFNLSVFSPSLNCVR